MSKLDYNDIVSHPIQEYLLKRLQRVQSAAAGFVLGRYANKLDCTQAGMAAYKWTQRKSLITYCFLKLCTLITGRHTLN